MDNTTIRRYNNRRNNLKPLKISIPYTLDLSGMRDITEEKLVEAANFVKEIFDTLNEDCWEPDLSIIETITIPVQIKKSLISGNDREKGIITIGKLVKTDLDAEDNIDSISILIYPKYIEMFRKADPTVVRVNVKSYNKYYPINETESNVVTRYQISYLELDNISDLNAVM